MKISFGVDKHNALVGLFGKGVITNHVVRKVIDHLKGQEEARRRDVGVPAEDGAVDDADLILVRARGRRGVDVARLQRRQRGRDLDDAELRARVHLRVRVPDVVEDVEHERAVAGAHLVDDQIVVRVQREPVVRHEISRDGLAVVGPEQLRRGVPQLPRRIGRFGLERVLEGDVPPRQLSVEVGFVLHARELERLSGREDHGLAAEVAVLRIVEAVCGSAQLQGGRSMG